MLITKVKVGKITNLSEARYCAGMGVDLLSFPVADVNPKMYQEITGWVAGPRFGIEVEKSTLDVIPQYGCDFVQTSHDLIDDISAKNLIVRLDSLYWASEKRKLIAIKNRILFLELIVPKIDSTTQAIIEDVSKEFEILLSFSNTTDIEAVLKLPVAGISLEGDAEIRPGLKEYHLADILEKLEEA